MLLLMSRTPLVPRYGLVLVEIPMQERESEASSSRDSVRTPAASLGAQFMRGMPPMNCKEHRNNAWWAWRQGYERQQAASDLTVNDWRAEAEATPLKYKGEKNRS